ncbi:DNA-binding MarR family transcriptional regulator [Desulfomicrobium macestii]|jgi:DNA-binding MarR family transcriptional regulator|uniref:DNA-binding MarR family transcriptional regulator n=1 Tax=Desulfomicrobium macestii TaxID=90731 RepID=A0ABR9H6B5_9BACT|nr:MarR family winged helix-turn-helix transcriptional regulator [Desulfomicrobium macestii]MBE1426247.1 DNA-binding MarR family transcriptional regulator [Desulfomicrobium macestii]
MNDTNEFILTTIRQFVRVARKYADAENLPIPVEGHGEISTREAHIIEAVGDTPEINVTALAKRFGVTKSAASQMVSRLVQKGFVDKSPAPHSNKEFILTLTELGWRGFAAHERFHGQDLARLKSRLGAFSLSQVATLSVLLEAIDDVIDKRLKGSD